MFYPNKSILESLLIFALFLVPMTQAESDELPQQVNQLQTSLIEANEKIAMLASDLQKTADTISTLQTDLNTTHQEINNLKSRRNQLPGINTGTRRTANGHGR
jgi:septal ring factor EnvC (AmiA/AmiB activator)